MPGVGQPRRAGRRRRRRRRRRRSRYASWRTPVAMAADRTLSGVRLADFDYELPPERHRPDADRAARRRPPARRPRAAPRPEHRHVRDLPELLRAGRPRRGQRHQGDPGPPAAAARDRRRGRGAAARAARRRAAHVGGAGAPGPQAARRRGAARRRRRRRSSRSARARRPATRSPSSCSAEATRWRARRARARCRCRRTSRRRSPTPSATRPSTPATRARRRRPTAGLHLTDEVLDAAAAPRASTSPRVELVVGLDTFQPIDRRRPARPPRCTASATACPPTTLARVPRARAAGRRRRHHRGAGPRVGGGAPASSSGRTDLFIHRGYDWQVVDVLLTNFHLPRTTLLVMIDAFVGAALARPLRPSRSPRATASSRSATRCSLDRARRPRDAPGRRIDGRRRTDGAARGRRRHDRPAARTARRASCRSAPAARSST